MKKRPETLKSKTTCIPTSLGKVYMTVTEDKNGKPFETFVYARKPGRDLYAFAEAIGRLISLHLRSGGKVGDVTEQLVGIGGEQPMTTNGHTVLSIPDGIGKVLERFYGEEGEKK